MENNWEYDYTFLYKDRPPQGQNTTPGSQGPVWEDPHHSGKPKKHWGRRIAAGALALIVCAGVGAGSGYLGYRLAAGNQAGGNGTVLYQSVERTSTSTGDKGDLSISDVVSMVADSVVEITTEQMVGGSYFSQWVESGAGSGVILSEDGYIITNNHVIEGASNIKVTLHDKTQYDATLVGADATTDIAVIKIAASGLTPAVLGDSSTLAVGETAIAIGNPLGSLGGTVTSGIISALDRDITVEGQTMRLLQTSAAISPGNSGGGLFNAQGELIGIVNAKSSDSESEGLGFAIPINTAKQVAEDLINSGYVTGRPALGITVLNVNSAQMAMQYGFNALGVYIYQVNEGSGAAAAGLQPGDRIVIIDGTEVSDSSDVTNVVQQKQVGDTVNLQVARDGEILSFDVVLGEQSQQAQQQNAGVSGGADSSTNGN